MPNEFSYYVKSSIPPAVLYVFLLQKLTDYEKTILGTLQGLLAGSSDRQIYFLDDHHPDYGVWLEELESKCELYYDADISQLIGQFSDKIYGFITYSDEDSILPSVSLAGIKNAIVVHESLKSDMIRLGLSELFDMRGKDDRFVFNHYWKNSLNHRMVIEQKPENTPYLFDYAVMTNSLIFSAYDDSLREEIMSKLEPDSAVLGWGDARDGEDKFVAPSSQKGSFVIPADWSLNLSVLSSKKSEPVKQNKFPLKYEDHVHYVCFMMSDGDNIQWEKGRLINDKKLWASSHRGKFSIGWALSPSLYDLAPSVVAKYYETASEGEVRDGFVAGPSGNGYMYPSMYPDEVLSLHTMRLNDYMVKMDLSVVEIIDFDSFYNLDIWKKYLDQPNIRGLFYLEYSLHNEHKGRILWSNNKPIISVKEMLWDGIKGCDVKSVSDHINQASRDVKSADAYSLVLVHVWSKKNGTLDALNKLVKRFNSDVRIVPPDTFVDLISHNLRGCNDVILNDICVSELESTHKTGVSAF